MIILESPQGPRSLELRTPITALEEMIIWTQNMQQTEAVGTIRKSISPNSYLNEYCTIRFGLPRQSGHTTAICYLAQKLFKNPILLAHNYGMAQDLKKTYKKFGGNPNRVFDSNRLENLRGLESDGVLFDFSWLHNALAISKELVPLMTQQDTFCFVLS